jgi:uncharacterized repeat protein (TIGR03803 family)
LAIDLADNLFGTTSGGGVTGSPQGLVFKIDAAGNFSVLYSFQGSFPDGSVPQAGVVLDAAGNLYGTTGYGGESGFGTIFKIDATGAYSILHSFVEDLLASVRDPGQMAPTRWLL